MFDCFYHGSSYSHSSETTLSNRSVDNATISVFLVKIPSDLKEI